MEEDDRTRRDLKWKTYSAIVKAEGNGKFIFTFSSSSVDRDRDVVSQEGIDLAPFRANPVVLWAHDYRTPPVARVVDMWFREGKLMGSVEFPPKGTFALADTVHGLVEAGFINATSIGFESKEWTYDEERSGINFLKTELYEISLVPVPSNRDALIEAAAKGVAVGPAVEWAKAILGREEPTVDVKAEIRVAIEEIAAKWLGPRIEIPEGYELLQAGECMRVSPKIAESKVEAPVETPAAAEESEEKSPRKMTESERKELASAVVAALKTVARREVNHHTGRLEN